MSVAVLAGKVTCMQNTTTAGACRMHSKVLTLSKHLCDAYTYQLLADSETLLWILLAACLQCFQTCLKYPLPAVVQIWSFLQIPSDE